MTAKNPSMRSLASASANALFAEAYRLREKNDALRVALQTVMRMDIKGHQLRDRLQFSDAGRAILAQVDAALA